MIRNIIFDIGNVLAHFRWEDYLREHFQPEIQYRMEMATVHSGYWDEVDRFVKPMEEIVDLCVKVDPELEAEIRAFFAGRFELVSEFSYSEEWLKTLKECGYRIYLLSNYAGDMFEFAKTKYKFLKYVDGEIISYQIHKIKPEPEIYEALLKKYDLDPKECLFIDDLERNLIGAKKFGIHTIQFKNKEQVEREMSQFGCETEKKGKKALIFDVDGTLWDTTEACAKIWNDVAVKYPEVTDTVTADKLKSLYGLPLEEIAIKLFPSVSEEKAIEVMEECVVAQCPILAKGCASLLGDVKGTFEKLTENYRLFIVSNCRNGYIEALLEGHDLGPYVEDFTCPGQTGKLKAENIGIICERNGIDKKDVIYVGDTLTDELSAREAGVDFIFAAYGFGQAKEYSREIHDISELLNLNTRKIVFMEADTLGKDIDISAFYELGEVVIYNKSDAEKNAERIKDADIIVVNKIPMNEAILKNCSKLKLICLTATGTNNVDFKYVNERGIAVANVKGYSTDSVAQHTFALLFYVYERLAFYDNYVKSGEYVKSDIFSRFDVQFNELAGKTWGIVGLGDIGRRVAGIAKLFGCNVVYYSTTGTHDDPEYKRVDKETLFRESDIVSIHAPLNESTLNLVNTQELEWMKKSAILLNLGRGPIVNQEALAEALLQDKIAGAGLDVLTVEPMSADNPLLKVQDSTKLIITPHIGWATLEARQRCVDEVCLNIKAYLNGEERNRCR